MIIQQSSIRFSAEHQKSELYEQQSSMEAFSMELQAVQSSAFDSLQTLKEARLDALRQQALREPFPGFLAMTDTGFRLQSGQPQTEPLAAMPWMSGSAKLFHSLLEALTGRQIAVAGIDGSDIAELESPPSQPMGSESGLPMRERVIEVSVKVSERIEEYECTRFSACGRVETADGQSIELNLDMTMERSYSASREFEISQQVRLKDPLVLNFNGSAAELTEEKFQFDLDLDGELELINLFGPDSALLALDTNEDGLINDGAELFGAASGDGFAELAAYDEDGNGFIDEADSIFEQLRLWSHLNGEGRLQTLAEKDVGAIYLGSTQTPFDLKDGDNRMQGRVRESGVYLTESGSVGTVQQVDMAV
ncbi:hypothetical protein [Marinobacterium arenosum]|uniref:hypothetical protein n=1 Tax=Marinobacterium arenosum TaxID=2862496 RepID=UPI001C98B727|nr:hypothetical protein [Marinobacterium arenosum]MBY4675095.1 hypothetical protein [Marinobacterium arenosum]